MIKVCSLGASRPVAIFYRTVIKYKTREVKKKTQRPRGSETKKIQEPKTTKLQTPTNPNASRHEQNKETKTKQTDQILTASTTSLVRLATRAPPQVRWCGYRPHLLLLPRRGRHSVSAHQGHRVGILTAIVRRRPRNPLRGL